MVRVRAAIDVYEAVVAFPDGAQVDDSTAWGIGYVYAKEKPVIDIRTDFRNGGDTSHGCFNAMIEGTCLGIAMDFEEVLKLLQPFHTKRV